MKSWKIWSNARFETCIDVDDWPKWRDFFSLAVSRRRLVSLRSQLSILGKLNWNAVLFGMFSLWCFCHAAHPAQYSTRSWCFFYIIFSHLRNNLLKFIKLCISSQKKGSRPANSIAQNKWSKNGRKTGKNRKTKERNSLLLFNGWLVHVNEFRNGISNSVNKWEWEWDRWGIQDRLFDVL